MTVKLSGCAKHVHIHYGNNQIKYRPLLDTLVPIVLKIKRQVKKITTTRLAI